VSPTLYDTAPNTGILALVPEGVVSALDIGCGTGQLGAQLMTRAIVTDGITFNQSEKEIASRYLRDVWLFDLESGLPPLHSKYDLIIMSHLLEHIAEPSPLMSALSSYLAKSGRVLCAIPNMLFLYNRLKLLFGRVEYEQYGLMDYTHVRWYTRKTIVKLFNAYGFEVERESVRGYLPLGPLRGILPGRLTASLDRSIVPLLPGILACELLYRFRTI